MFSLAVLVLLDWLAMEVELAESRLGYWVFVMGLEPADWVIVLLDWVVVAVACWLATVSVEMLAFCSCVGVDVVLADVWL